jgi:hypothetical protein
MEHYEIGKWVYHLAVDSKKWDRFTQFLGEAQRYDGVRHICELSKDASLCKEIYKRSTVTEGEMHTGSG